MQPLLDRRFLFVTGKGGVGKTTTAAALAWALGQHGRRVLVTACDDKERISTLFDRPPLTPEIHPVGHNVHAVKLVPDEAMREYGAMNLHSRAVFSAVFNRRMVQRFLGGVPGLSEWAMLGKAWYHSTENRPDGSPRFDSVIFDGPATGHALNMLRVPQVILDVAPPGILRRDAEHALEMFRDPRHTGVVVVALPEELPTTETLELVGALRGELFMPVAELVVNGVVEPLFSPEDRVKLVMLADLLPANPAEAALVVAAGRAVREELQATALRRLAPLGLPQLTLPFLPGRASSPEAISRLAEYFE